MMDRVVIIPFRVSIPREEQNKNLTEILIKEEGPGILAWAVKGSVLRIQEGLGRVPINQTEIREVKPVPTVKGFIETYCVLNDKASTKTSKLYDAYNEYRSLVDEDAPGISIKEFGTQLGINGFTLVHSNDGNYRPGIRLVTEADAS